MTAYNPVVYNSGEIFYASLTEVDVLDNDNHVSDQMMK